MKQLIMMLFLFVGLTTLAQKELRITVRSNGGNQPLIGAEVRVKGCDEKKLFTDSTGTVHFVGCKKGELKYEVIDIAENHYKKEGIYEFGKSKADELFIRMYLTNEGFLRVFKTVQEQEKLKFEQLITSLDTTGVPVCENDFLEENHEDSGNVIIQPAGFPGGAQWLQIYIGLNVFYPEVAIEMEDQGKVHVSFVVETDGSISNVRIEKGVTKELDREARRVIESMPNWLPAICNNRLVRTRATLPIVFVLE